MQKKIVAAICAAALALALPMAAFAGNNTDKWVNFNQDSAQKSMAVANIDEVKAGNVTLTNVKAVGVTDYVTQIKASAAGTSMAVPSNAITGSVQSFSFQARNNVDSNLKSFGTKWNSLSGDIKFAEGVTAELNGSVDTDNLYVVKVYNNQKGEEIYRSATQVTVPNDGDNGASPAAAEPTGFSFAGAGSGTLTVWMQNGPYGINPQQVIDDLNKSAENSKTSPKTGELL